MRFQNRNSFVFQILGTKINELFSQWTYNFQILRSETRPIADHKDVDISKFALVNIKLLLKEANILHFLSESNLINTTSDFWGHPIGQNYDFIMYI